MAKASRPSAGIVPIRSIAAGRPYPPKELTESGPDRFVPAPNLREWLVRTFVDEQGCVANEDHAHLRFASFGTLWTNSVNSRHQRRIVGEAELMPPRGGTMGKWQRARALQQIAEWFGAVPDFLLTFDAPAAARCDDASFCALVEHELYHCGQELDAFGAPKFTREGLPRYAIRGHDVEEFVGVVRRYGANASNAGRLVDAMAFPPEIGAARIAGACGTCLRAAA